MKKRERDISSAYVLPSGNVTNNCERYARVWRKLGRQVASELSTGTKRYELCGWDPDIAIAGVNSPYEMSLHRDVALKIYELSTGRKLSEK